MYEPSIGCLSGAAVGAVAGCALTAPAMPMWKHGVVAASAVGGHYVASMGIIARGDKVLDVNYAYVAGGLAILVGGVYAMAGMAPVKILAVAAGSTGGRVAGKMVETKL